MMQLAKQGTKLLRLGESVLPPLVYHIQDFLHAKASKEASTIAFYELPLRQYREHVGDRFWPPNDSSINSYLAACKKRGLKENTLNAYFRAIRTWLIWLHKRGVIERNPIDLVERPSRSKLVPRAPKLAILTSWFETMKHEQSWQASRDLALFSLLLDTGLRVGEAARLRLDDLNYETQEIRIAGGKTKSERYIVFTRLAAQRLRAWEATRAELQVPAKLEHLFVSRPTGTMIWRDFVPDAMRAARDRWLARIGVEVPIRLHDLRHAYAIYTLKNGGDLEDIQHQLGHKNIATTAVYLIAYNEGRRVRHEVTSPLNYTQIEEGGASDES
jgi:site-specific recombinase XerD